MCSLQLPTLFQKGGDKEAFNKADSNSITNQREMALAFLQEHPDITLHEIRVDDGYTGSSFDRPAIQRLLGLAQKGEINCIVVKDLSRFGRNYIEVGSYLKKVLPFLGVVYFGERRLRQPKSPVYGQAGHSFQESAQRPVQPGLFSEGQAQQAHHGLAG